jgi:hypothetical protein
MIEAKTNQGKYMTGFGANGETMGQGKMLFVNLIKIIPKMFEGAQIALPYIIQMVFQFFYAGLPFVVDTAL